MTATIPAPAAVPVFPLSIFAPVHIGIDEFGELVHVELAERNMLIGGEPGGGKSSAINLITAHGALSGDCRLILIDGKQVELGLWRDCADRFVGPSMADALETMRWLQGLMNTRYDQLVAAGLRKITPASGEPVYLVIIDEYAYFSATVGTKPNRDEFSALVRDLVARGRAAGVIVILATQRPSHQVIDPSLRDLFGYRWAFRCTTDSSSDTVLGHGWAGQGYTAATIDPLARGVSWLLAETGIPAGSRPPTSPMTTSSSWPPTPPSSAGRRTPMTASQHCSRCGNAVKPALTRKRTRRHVESDEYAAFTRRVLRGYARRIAAGDIDAIADLGGLLGDVETALSRAVTGLRDSGYSWAEIGLRLGVTRQAVHQRWADAQP
jgi:DNA segregation ATPase FtsK/SpoIIIE, S-DNA-T family